MNKTLINFILRNATEFPWSVQGLGMLRLHLPDNARLHIWHSSLKVPNVSEIHDHLQWGLTSHIIAGTIINHKYIECDVNTRRNWEPYWSGTLKAGYGCHFQGDKRAVCLAHLSSNHYHANRSGVVSHEYSQEPSEIHRTEAVDGTITFMQKRPTDTDLARVYWTVNEQWVSAEPREATRQEVERVTSDALKMLLEVGL